MKIIDKAINSLLKLKIKNTDNLINVLSSATANARDVTNPANSFYAQDFVIPYSQLENIYISSWVGRKVVEIPNEYIFKNGFHFRIEDMPDLEEKVMRLYNEWKVEDKLKQADLYARIYGGCVILPKDKTQDPNKKYDWSQFKDKRIEFVVRDSSYLAITPNIDLTSERYFEPETVLLSGLSADAENFIIFKGMPAPLRKMPQFRYMGMSIFQNIYQALIADEYTSKGIANMVYRGNMKYYFIEGFEQLVKQGQECLALSKLSAIENYANVMSAGVLDKNDDVKFVQQAFSGLPEIDSRSIARLSASTNIPATVLLGKSPDGMNATGEADLENFYNYIENEQHRREESVKKVLRILICVAGGDEKTDFDFHFNKPQNIDPNRQVETDGKSIDNLQKLEQLGFGDDIIKAYAIDKGIITTEQAEELVLLNKEIDENELDPEDTDEE